jgi:hypothetical protein
MELNTHLVTLGMKVTLMETPEGWSLDLWARGGSHTTGLTTFKLLHVK